MPGVDAVDPHLFKKVLNDPFQCLGGKAPVPPAAADAVADVDAFRRLAALDHPMEPMGSPNSLRTIAQSYRVGSP